MFLIVPYRLKVWEDGDPEPNDWVMEYTEPFSEPVTGSFYLNAHYSDVTFHDIQVTEIEGDDIFKGTEGSDVIAAAGVNPVSAGLGELDVLIGGGGSDSFVLGDVSGNYYDDGVSSSGGLEDYALVWDFESGNDTIQLAGPIDDYLFEDTSSGSLPDGLAIYYLNGTDEDELIGVVNGQDVASFDTNDVVFGSQGVA